MKKDKKDVRRQIEQPNIWISTLTAISKTIGSNSSLDEILNSIMDRILESGEPDNIRVYLLDDEKEGLHLSAHKGFSANFINQPFVRCCKSDEGIMGQTLLDGEVKVVEHTQTSNSSYADRLLEEGIQSTVYIPLKNKGTPMGVMCVSRHSPDKFSSEFVEFLTAVGSHTCVAVIHAGLQKNIQKAYQDLKEFQEQMVWTEKLASLGKLAATIAHEINNPLAAVLTYIRLLIKLVERNRFSPERLEDISRYLNTMESETARCGDIVKDLLAFARRAEVTIERNNIEDIINKSLNLISHDLELKEIELQKFVAQNLPKAKCDFKQVQQVFLNLMVNASEAMPNGGTLTIKIDRAVGAEAFLEVEISDTGSGIDKKDMEHIFEPFFTTKQEEKGVGLGLSVVYGIIAKHNGAIAVKSEPGKGSIFTVRLPC